MDEAFALFSLRPSSRIAAAACLYAAGAALQLLFPWGFAPGILLIASGWLFLVLKPVTNRPADQGLEAWRPVSMTEVDRLADTLRQSKALRLKTMGGSFAGIALSALFLCLAALTWSATRGLSLLFLDLFLFLVPPLFFGRVRVFIPRLLDLKLPCFQAIFEEKAADKLVLTPYFRFDKDEAGADVPEDLRIMVEPKRKPSDFLGVQFQAAINKGPNGEVPYLYAVFLTEGKGESYGKLCSTRPKGFVVERGGDGAHGTIVLRQDTGGGGYATKPGDCARLYRAVLSLLSEAGMASV